MIYCVEDDSAIRRLMVYTINASGFEAEGFENARSFWEGMYGKRPEMILLDIMLPDEDGLQILKKLRSNVITADIPVIMASAKGTEYDKVIGLDLGADDYLAKPFGMLEMMSRIKAVLRRTGTEPVSKELISGPIRIDENSHEVHLNDQRIELTLKEYEMLRLFLMKPGTVFSREALMHAVWGSDFLGETRTVDVHIASLRMKIGAAGNNIRTVRGVGYRWEGTADHD